MTSCSPFPWPGGQKIAVSLTYDDAIPNQYEIVGPLLNSVDLRATFYLTLRDMLENHRQEPFAALARVGHELGNHTIFHPCRISPHWKPHWNLEAYNLPMWCNEVDAANAILTMVDGQTERTYGNTCHCNLIGPDGSEICIDDAIEERFLAGRGVSDERVCDPWTRPLANLGCRNGDNDRSLESLLDEVKKTFDMHGWLILCFHNIGAGNARLQLDQQIHEQFVRYLADRKEAIWTAPVRDIARHVRQVRELPFSPGN